MKPLSRKFYSRSTVEVARDLIGKTLIRKAGNKILSGTISETEAYTSDDPASHSFIGRTPRNALMFGPPGHAYVYFIYGNHFCLNVVARGKQPSGAVLIRGITGIEGPGRLTKAFSIDKKHNGIDLTANQELYIADSTFNGKILRTPRIGITKAKEKKWRFIINK